MTRPLARVQVECAAKVNIGWHVGRRRDDGYHEVFGLMHTISLVDRLEITRAEGDGLRLKVPGHPELENESNLVHAAVEALGDVSPPPTSVVVHKAIPVGAGLGGGSADAAGALVGLNALWGTGVRPRRLADLAATIGSDVPGILMGGLVHASGRGERVRNVGAFDEGWLVLGVCDEQVSAKAAYERFDALAEGAEPAELHHNDLERAACELVHGLRERLAAMRAHSGVAFVSGSGPTVVGVCADEAHARGVAANMRDRFAAVHVARPIPWGVRLTLSSLD